ncbi:MAG: YcgL domain-containing protein [Thiohalomonadales bacterium]
MTICAIYRSQKKLDSYLYITKKDEMSEIPQRLLDMLGALEFIMELDLSQRRTLAQADPLAVTEALQQQGYYLQLARKEYIQS